MVEKGKTAIQVSRDTAMSLRMQGRKGETYDTIINRLLLFRPLAKLGYLSLIDEEILDEVTGCLTDGDVGPELVEKLEGIARTEAYRVCGSDRRLQEMFL